MELPKQLIFHPKQLDEGTPPKFKKHDHVKIGNDDAIIREHTTRTYSTDKISYAYSVFFKERGGAAWFEEDKVEFVATEQSKLLEKWESTLKQIETQHADLNWIFSPSLKDGDQIPPASLKTLGKHLGIENMWGNYGEGMVYELNCRSVLDVAGKFLRERDKAGFLEWCKHKQIHVFEKKTTRTISLDKPLPIKVIHD